MKQRNLWPSNIQGPIGSQPLDPSMFLSDPFNFDNETKAKEVYFSAYPKLSLINKIQKTSELSSREKRKVRNVTMPLAHTIKCIWMLF